MLDANSISVVLNVYKPERARLIELLSSLDDSQWSLPTECPAYDVKGIATHVLGDDFSLLSRQRDAAENGLVRVAAGMPGASFMELLDTFNDQWVDSAAFFSPRILTELLRLAGDWTADYYSSVDPGSDGEYVGFFGGQGPTSPFWQAIAREFLERWVHHSQIRRALGLGPLADTHFVEVGVAIVATIARVDTSKPGTKESWSFGEIVLGDNDQTANILTRGYGADAIRALVDGPAEAVDRLALVAGRPESGPLA